MAPEEEEEDPPTDPAPEFRELFKRRREDILFCQAAAGDGLPVYAGSSDGGVYAIAPTPEAEDETAEPFGGHSSYVTGITAVEGGAVLVSGGYDRHLIWHRRESGTEIRRQRAHEKWLRGVEAAPGGMVVASVADDMVCRLWDATSGTLLHELRGHDAETPHHYPSMLFACAFDPSGSRLATVDKPGNIVLWSVADGSRIGALEAPGMYTWDPKARRHSIGGIRSVAFSPDGHLIAVGGMGEVGNIDHLGGKARIEIFDIASGERLAELESNTFNGLVESLAFTPDARYLVAGGGDNNGFLLAVDISTEKIVAESKTDFHVHSISLDRDTTIVAVGHQHVGSWLLEQVTPA
ncbi:hypothetical protein BH23VER1_BH23VER1_00620 [soil metagenome]